MEEEQLPSAQQEEAIPLQVIDDMADLSEEEVAKELQRMHERSERVRRRLHQNVC